MMACQNQDQQTKDKKKIEVRFSPKCHESLMHA